MSVWNSGRLHAVYNPVRVGNEILYRQANFSVLEWAPTASSRWGTYVIPNSIVDVDDNQLNDLVAHETEVGTMFGYFSLDPIVVEPHQADGSDSWVGLHTFGYV